MVYTGILEEHMTNNDSLKSIQKELNNPLNNGIVNNLNLNLTPEEQNIIITDRDISKKIADNNKLLNSSNELIKKAKYVHGEKKTLENAISNNITLANSLSKQRSMPFINSKERLSEINNNEFRKKQKLVNRLIYIIYFILFSIGLGFAMAVGFITVRILGIVFIIGLLILLYFLIVSESFWKTYGDFTMGLAKEAVKEVVKTVGPVKKCPDRCNTKVPYYGKINKILRTDSDENDSTMCTKKQYEDDIVAPYEYNYLQSDINNKDYRDCDIGQYGTCKDDRETSFVCKLENGVNDDNRQEYIKSSVPCSFYNNRVNVKNH